MAELMTDNPNSRFPAPVHWDLDSRRVEQQPLNPNRFDTCDADWNTSGFDDDSTLDGVIVHASAFALAA